MEGAVMKTSTTDHICPGRSSEMAATCEGLDEETRARTLESPVPQCFQDQLKYHASLEYDLVDLAMVEPEDQRGLLTQHRPSTRLLHWASHGVPTIFWPFESYLDLAEDGEYFLPNGLPPAYDPNNATSIWTLVDDLADSKARLALRVRGLELAAKYSPLGAAKQLLYLHKHGELEASSAAFAAKASELRARFIPSKQNPAVPPQLQPHANPVQDRSVEESQQQASTTTTTTPVAVEASPALSISEMPPQQSGGINFRAYDKHVLDSDETLESHTWSFPILDLSEYRPREEAMLSASDIFSVNELPCPVSPADGPLSLPSGTRIAVFFYTRLRGTSRMRGDMIAAAVSTIPGWVGIIAPIQLPVLPMNVTLEMCVAVKHSDKRFFGWCHRNNAKVIYHDILDDWQPILAIMNRGALSSPDIDVLLAPDKLISASANAGNK
eukprot:CAMPEP_0178443666 /NCGR_PEP_ID=MMETSP0689_2-20121128/39032_1 /TAXON_ID=160604 /ORGANISM="Amphidinium massartii, Strain CS-259" /LENGTH=439 /DNA_ID=CAMNT_0020067719 /DNA_START=234 /DNA_END=1550 /DNA_ORIENTATION=-